MKIYRDKKDLNTTRAITFFRVVKDPQGTPVKENAVQGRLLISDDSKFYYEKEVDNNDFVADMKEANIPVNYDDNGRKYSPISVEGHQYGCQVARVMKIMFDDDKYPIEHYQDLELDHIDPRVPLSNCLENVEFVTHEENMRRAGETGVMIKKYPKELAHKICQMICDGVPRAEIKETLGVNGQLVDDIRSGRSHKSVSSQYLDKGFQYKTFDRYYRDDLLHEICRTIEANPSMRNCDISRKLGGVDHRLICAIRNKQCYTRISKYYNF